METPVTLVRQGAKVIFVSEGSLTPQEAKGLAAQFLVQNRRRVKRGKEYIVTVNDDMLRLLKMDLSPGG